MLEIRQLVRRYGALLVLDRVSFDVSDSQFPEDGVALSVVTQAKVLGPLATLGAGPIRRRSDELLRRREVEQMSG